MRCKVIGFPTVLLPPAALSAVAVVAVVVAVVAAAAVAGFRRLDSESSVDASPSSRVLFDAAPMIATPAAPPVLVAPPAGP